MKNRHHPALLIYSMGLSFKTTPSNFLFLLQKITLLSFVGLAYGFCHSLFVPQCNSLLFLNKPIFAAKITFIFKVIENACVIHMSLSKLR